MEGVGALILADAVGSGFGGAMALGEWGGKFLVRRLIDAARDAGIETMLVVIGPRAEDVLDAVEFDDAIVVINDDYEEGSASSIRAGLDTMWRLDEIDTAMVMDVRRPSAGPEAVSAILEAAPDADRPMTLPKYRYARGGPVAIHRSLWPRLMGLEGEVDLIDLAAAHPAWVTEIHLDVRRPPEILSPDDLVGLGRPPRLT